MYRHCDYHTGIEKIKFRNSLQKYTTETFRTAVQNSLGNDAFAVSDGEKGVKVRIQVLQSMFQLPSLRHIRQWYPFCVTVFTHMEHHLFTSETKGQMSRVMVRKTEC